MADIYNVVSGDGVFFEGLTKEQIYELIAEMTGETVQDVDQAFITKLKEINKGNSIRLWVGTSAEYNALATKEEDVLYICTDDTFVYDTGVTLEDLKTKIEANNDAVTERLNNFETEFEQFKEDVNGEVGAGVRINDLGSYTCVVIGSESNPSPYVLPSIDIGEIGKLKWLPAETDAPLFGTMETSWGGFQLPSSGLYFLMYSAGTYTYHKGSSDDPDTTVNDYTTSELCNGGQVFMDSGDKFDDVNYGGGGYIFYLRLA